MFGGVTLWPRTTPAIKAHPANAADSGFDIRRCMRFGEVAMRGAVWQARPSL